MPVVKKGRSGVAMGRDVNKDASLKAKARTKDWRFKAKARTKDLTFKAKDRTKDCFHLSV